MTTRSGSRVYRRAPKPLEPGACPQCSRVIGITPSGRRRMHRDLEGRDCTGSGVRVGEEAVPAEVLSAARIVVPERRQPVREKPGADPRERARPKRALTKPSPTGHCHTCDRAITGERIYCGPCAAARNRERR